MQSEFLTNVAEAMKWTEEEARNFMGHFVAASEEQLMADIQAACEWATGIEEEAAIIAVMKKMPARSMEVKWNDGDMEMRLTPEKAEEE